MNDIEDVKVTRWKRDISTLSIEQFEQLQAHAKARRATQKSRPTHPLVSNPLVADTLAEHTVMARTMSVYGQSHIFDSNEPIQMVSDAETTIEKLRTLRESVKKQMDVFHGYRGDISSMIDEINAVMASNPSGKEALDQVDIFKAKLATLIHDGYNGSDTLAGLKFFMIDRIDDLHQDEEYLKLQKRLSRIDRAIDLADARRQMGWSMDPSFDPPKDFENPMEALWAERQKERALEQEIANGLNAVKAREREAALKAAAEGITLDPRDSRRFLRPMSMTRRVEAAILAGIAPESKDPLQARALVTKQGMRLRPMVSQATFDEPRLPGPPRPENIVTVANRIATADGELAPHRYRVEYQTPFVRLEGVYGPLTPVDALTEELRRAPDLIGIIDKDEAVKASRSALASAKKKTVLAPYRQTSRTTEWQELKNRNGRHSHAGDKFRYAVDRVDAQSGEVFLKADRMAARDVTARMELNNVPDLIDSIKKYNDRTFAAIREHDLSVARTIINTPGVGHGDIVIDPQSLIDALNSGRQSSVNGTKLPDPLHEMLRKHASWTLDGQPVDVDDALQNMNLAATEILRETTGIKSRTGYLEELEDQIAARFFKHQFARQSDGMKDASTKRVVEQIVNSLKASGSRPGEITPQQVVRAHRNMRTVLNQWDTLEKGTRKAGMSQLKFLEHGAQASESDVRRVFHEISTSVMDIKTRPKPAADLDSVGASNYANALDEAEGAAGTDLAQHVHGASDTVETLRGDVMYQGMDDTAREADLMERAKTMLRGRFEAVGAQDPAARQEAFAGIVQDLTTDYKMPEHEVANLVVMAASEDPDLLHTLGEQNLALDLHFDSDSDLKGFAKMSEELDGARISWFDGDNRSIKVSLGQRDDLIAQRNTGAVAISDTDITAKVSTSDALRASYDTPVEAHLANSALPRAANEVPIVGNVGGDYNGLTGMKYGRMSSDPGLTALNIRAIKEGHTEGIVLDLETTGFHWGDKARSKRSVETLEFAYETVKWNPGEGGKGALDVTEQASILIKPTEDVRTAAERAQRKLKRIMFSNFVDDKVNVKARKQINDFLKSQDGWYLRNLAKYADGDVGVSWGSKDPFASLSPEDIRTRLIENVFDEKTGAFARLERDGVSRKEALIRIRSLIQPPTGPSRVIIGQNIADADLNWLRLMEDKVSVDTVSGMKEDLQVKLTSGRMGKATDLFETGKTEAARATAAAQEQAKNSAAFAESKRKRANQLQNDAQAVKHEVDQLQATITSNDPTVLGRRADAAKARIRQITERARQAQEVLDSKQYEVFNDGVLDESRTAAGKATFESMLDKAKGDLDGAERVYSSSHQAFTEAQQFDMGTAQKQLTALRVRSKEATSQAARAGDLAGIVEEQANTARQSVRVAQHKQKIAASDAAEKEIWARLGVTGQDRADHVERQDQLARLNSLKGANEITAAAGIERIDAPMIEVMHQARTHDTGFKPVGQGGYSLESNVHYHARELENQERGFVKTYASGAHRANVDVKATRMLSDVYFNKESPGDITYLRAATEGQRGSILMNYTNKGNRVIDRGAYEIVGFDDGRVKSLHLKNLATDEVARLDEGNWSAIQRIINNSFLVPRGDTTRQVDAANKFMKDLMHEDVNRVVGQAMSGYNQAAYQEALASSAVSGKNQIREYLKETRQLVTGKNGPISIGDAQRVALTHLNHEHLSTYADNIDKALVNVNGRQMEKFKALHTFFQTDAWKAHRDGLNKIDVLQSTKVISGPDANRMIGEMNRGMKNLAGTYEPAGIRNLGVLDKELGIQMHVNTTNSSTVQDSLWSVADKARLAMWPDQPEAAGKARALNEVVLPWLRDNRYVSNGTKRLEAASTQILRKADSLPQAQVMDLTTITDAKQAKRLGQEALKQVDRTKIDVVTRRVANRNFAARREAGAIPGLFEPLGNDVRSGAATSVNWDSPDEVNWSKTSQHLVDELEPLNARRKALFVPRDEWQHLSQDRRVDIRAQRKEIDQVRGPILSELNRRVDHKAADASDVGAELARKAVGWNGDPAEAMILTGKHGGSRLGELAREELEGFVKDDSIRRSRHIKGMGAQLLERPAAAAPAVGNGATQAVEAAVHASASPARQHMDDVAEHVARQATGHVIEEGARKTFAHARGNMAKWAIGGGIAAIGLGAIAALSGGRKMTAAEKYTAPPPPPDGGGGDEGGGGPAAPIASRPVPVEPLGEGGVALRVRARGGRGANYMANLVSEGVNSSVPTETNINVRQSDDSTSFTTESVQGLFHSVLTRGYINQ